MEKLEWPGIATAAAIILIVAIAFDFSKWQPLMAALIALGGGVLAYKGAMEKARIDREEHKREFLRRQLAYYLKLELAAERLLPNVNEIDSEIFVTEDVGDAPFTLFKITEPAEISEAWEHLDVFPRRLIRVIATIRTSIRRIDDAVKESSENGKIDNIDGNDPNLKYIKKHVRSIIEACVLIQKVLGPEIEQLAPKLPEEERQLAIRGVRGISEGY